jgi:Uma2 family endonuclease
MRVLGTWKGGAAVSVAEPQSRLWTKDEYYQMAELGWFVGQRVELLEGEIVVFSPQKPEHYTTVDRVAAVLEACFSTGFCVRRQGPLDLGAVTEPEPDVAAVVGSREDYRDHHPTTAVLVVEVSDTSLGYDRGRKASLYARAGIADYWIVNLVDGQLEIRRDPVPDASQHYGFGYAHETIHTAPDSVAPLAAPRAAIAVADLLP